MKVLETSLPGVVILEPRVFADERGFFLESWNEEKFSGAGLDLDFVQDNHSRSSKGVLRGLHYQLDKPQGKLVRVVTGAVFDVAVDVRQGSQTFGEWVGVELNEENKRQMYVPEGFAHGFCVLSDTADFLYKCTEYYSPESEYGIAWNDPDIGIEWPMTDVIISEKDSNNRKLVDMADKLPIVGDLT